MAAGTWRTWSKHMAPKSNALQEHKSLGSDSESAPSGGDLETGETNKNHGKSRALEAPLGASPDALKEVINDATQIPSYPPKQKEIRSLKEQSPSRQNAPTSRAQNLQKAKGWVWLDVDNGWAEVWYKEKKLGETPFQTQLPQGHYRLRLVNPKIGIEKKVDINVQAGKKTGVNIRF